MRIMLFALAIVTLTPFAAHADALRCDAYFGGIEYTITATTVTQSKLEAVMVDENDLDNVMVQTENFGECTIKNANNGTSTVYLGQDSRDQSLSLVLPEGAPWHKSAAFEGALRVDFGTGTPVEAMAKCQIL